eukprot:5043926-Pyramimonas_sp.AAC.1
MMLHHLRCHSDSSNTQTMIWHAGYAVPCELYNVMLCSVMASSSKRTSRRCLSTPVAAMVAKVWSALLGSVMLYSMMLRLVI